MSTETFPANVIQFLRPHGRKSHQTIDLPIHLAGLYNKMLESGARFEAEVLTTGEVSISVSDFDEDLDIEIVPNGPEVLTAFERLLVRQFGSSESFSKISEE